MRIAAFNVENLFDRAKAFNADPDDARQVEANLSDLHALFAKLIYSEVDRARMIVLLRELGIDRDDEGTYVILRQIRGKLLKRPRRKPVEVVAKGRDDWVGWCELRTEPVNEIAILNTGRVIRDVDADILAVVEAENRTALKMFTDQVLVEVGGQAYDQVMVIDGNDMRGIDVGVLTKRGCTIGDMRSHIHDTLPNGRPVFSRDCPEYAITTNNGALVWVLPNHFKSKFGGNDPTSKAKRLAQSRRTAEIYQALRNAGHNNVVVLGDLNDSPESEELAPLLKETDLMDVSTRADFEVPTIDRARFPGKGTFGLGSDTDKIDYLLLSPALMGAVTACGLFRRGAWPGSAPRRWEVYPEIVSEVHVASDHHVIWADIAI